MLGASNLHGEIGLGRSLILLQQCRMVRVAFLHLLSYHCIRIRLFKLVLYI